MATKNLVTLVGKVHAKPVTDITPGAVRSVLTRPARDADGNVYPAGTEFQPQSGGHHNTNHPDDADRDERLVEIVNR